MKYWLRKVIFEDRWQEQLEELIGLCGRAQIDGVLLMEESHLLLMSPWPLERHRRMAGIYRRMGERLKQEGIRFGVNIASLVGHTDMEVPEEYRLGFQKWVGESGKEAHACYCIQDEAWQDYAAEVCRLYASAGPECLFVDDDFRSLNHGSLLGCFCPIHVKKTAERLERPVSAEDIRQALREESEEALRIRTAWMEANYEGQEQAAGKIERAVHEEDPSVSIGLMSSDELRHSLQGRPIGRLLGVFAGEGRTTLYRPTGAIYGDAMHKAVFEGHQRMALTMGEIHTPFLTYSELELFPHSRYNCSRRFSEIMLRTQILAGADDITLNLYDYLGNPVEQEPVWEEMLKENRKPLEHLQELRRGKKLKGFGLPYRMTESRYRTQKNGSAAELYPDRSLDLLLPAMGIPVQFTEGEGNAVIGEAIRCYSDEELQRFLSKGFLTDARGAQILTERGFGEYLGCRVLPAQEKIPAAEEILSLAGEFTGDLIPTRWNRFSRQERFLLEPENGAEEITRLLDLENRRIGAGTVLFHNSLGGRVAVSAVRPVWDAWAYRPKACLVRSILLWLAPSALPLFIPDCPDLGPIYYENDETGEGLLAVLNGSLDGYRYRVESEQVRLIKRAEPGKAGGSGESFRLEGLDMEIWETRRIR